MLNIIFLWDSTECPVKYLMTRPEQPFSMDYKLNWLRAPFVQELVRDVDKSHIAEGPVLISNRTGEVYDPYHLSGGTKTLLLMYHKKDSYMYNLSMLGSNCSKYLPIACGGDADIYGILPYPMEFTEIRSPFKCYNDGSIITSVEEYDACYRRYSSARFKDINWSYLTKKYGNRFEGRK